jgi:hypothetical protein
MRNNGSSSELVRQGMPGRAVPGRNRKQRHKKNATKIIPPKASPVSTAAVIPRASKGMADLHRCRQILQEERRWSGRKECCPLRYALVNKVVPPCLGSLGA